MTPSAYPLQWPKGKPRFKSRLSSRFKVTLPSAVRRLEAELQRIGAKAIVISSNQAPLSERNPDDPGVAVYFQLKERATVLACDRYYKVMENVAAIAAHIEATRLCERHGVATLEEMFAGFVALPPGTYEANWRAILGNPKTRVQAEAAYRERMKDVHPDTPGGSAEKAISLNAAIELAREIFK